MTKATAAKQKIRRVLVLIDTFMPLVPLFYVLMTAGAMNRAPAVIFAIKSLM
jgi:hypothetical protein